MGIAGRDPGGGGQIPVCLGPGNPYKRAQPVDICPASGSPAIPMPHAIVLIPARMASTRLPGKPLADIAGQPMIVHVLRRAIAARVGEAVVATDSESVAAAVEKAGGRAVMTRADHVSGSDRIFEALEALDPEHAIDIVVNVQGDLPTIDPADIRAALKPLADREVDIATIAAEITDAAELTNPNVVKVKGVAVAPGRLRATTFTRANAAGAGPALSSHRALRLSARGAGALRQARAMRQRAARTARAIARARCRHAHRRHAGESRAARRRYAGGACQSAQTARRLT